jgi:hypothetical protein
MGTDEPIGGSPDAGGGSGWLLTGGNGELWTGAVGAA